MEKINIKTKIWLVFTVGIILVLLSIILDSHLNEIGYLAEFSGATGRTLVGAALVALIFRLPLILELVNKSGINLLTDNEFLRRLSPEELSDLRASVTKHAYLKTTNSANSSLNNLDSTIANLFNEPYYESFTMNFRCRFLGDGFIEKTISTSFVFKNPKNTPCDASEYFRSRVVQEKNDNVKEEDLRKIARFQVIKDEEGDFVDYSKAYKLKFSSHHEESSTYNVVSKLVNTDTNSKLNLIFNDTLQLKIVEKRIVPKTDKIYINRITSPTERFLINYSFDGCNVNLLGSGFGTFQNTKDGGINIFKDPNSIQIASEKWLLTGNGIMIVHDYP